MKTHYLSVPIVALLSSGAFGGNLDPVAADPIIPAVVQTAPSVTNWSGAYVGGSLAYTTGSALYCDGDANGDDYDCDDPSDGLPEPTPEGGMIGITGGYDWQRGNIVYGVAGDLMFGDLSDGVDSSTDPYYGCGSGDARCGLEISSVAMLRGRVGFATGDFLPYITAGLAVTQATAFDNASDPVDGTYTNAVIGVGAEYMVSDTMSVGLDLLQIIEGSEVIIFDDFCTDCGPTHFSATMARFTLSYRF